MPVDDPRDRRTKGFNRARFKLELRRGLKPSGVIAAAVVAALAMFAYAVNQIAPGILASTYTAKVAVSDATSVVAKVNEVRFKGIPVGKIDAVAVEDNEAVLTISVDEEYGQIYNDARAQLRPATPLQDMYLDIVDRGTPEAGELGETEPLPAVQTEVPVNISDVLNVFGPSQRLRMRTLLDELGNGLDDRGRSLRAIFVELMPFVEGAGEITRQLGERGPLVKRLIHNTSLLTQELGDREEQLRVLLTQGGSTLRTLQGSSADLDETLRELPPTLATIRSSFSEVRETLDDVDGAVRALYPVADELPGSLTDLKALSDAARPAVQALRAPVTDLVPFAERIQPLARNLDDATEALLPQIDTVDKATTDLVLCERGVTNFFQWNASISKFGDVRGPLPRGNVVFGAQSSSFFNDPNEFAPSNCSPGQVIGGRVPEAKDKH